MKQNHSETKALPTAGELRRETRLRRIARALASGSTVKDIAEAEGISRTYASSEANSADCRQYLAEFVNSELGELQGLFYRGLRVLEKAFSARREYMTKDGQIVYGGPDHYARMAATKALKDLLASGRPVAKLPEKVERREVTLQELRDIIAEKQRLKEAEENAGAERAA